MAIAGERIGPVIVQSENGAVLLALIRTTVDSQATVSRKGGEAVREW